MATLDINDVLPQVDYTAIAAQTAFTVPFEFFADADLVVLVDGEVQALNTDYTVTGAEVEGGGAVTFTAGLAGGEAVRIFTDIAIARDVKYTQSGSLSHLVLERDMAKQIRISQQLERDIGRCIRLMQSDPAVSMELPSAEDRANKYLAFGASGELEVAEEVTGTTLSQSVIGGYLYPRTAAEIAAGVTPAYYHYAPGVVERYGANTIPGTTDMYAAITAALRQNEQDGGADVVTGATTYQCSAGLTWCAAGQDWKVWHANNTTLQFSSDVIGLTVGSIAAATECVSQKILGNLYAYNTIGSTTSTKEGFRFQQCYEGEFHISALGWEWGYRCASNNVVNCGYNEFYPGRIRNNTRGFAMDTLTDGVCNQNTHHGGRFAVSNTGQWLVDFSGASCNSNRFIGTSFEMANTGALQGHVYMDGLENQLITCRFEGGGTISQDWVVIDVTARGYSIIDCYGLRDGYITGRGRGGKIVSVDEHEFTDAGGGAATVPTLAYHRSKSNADAIPVARFWDMYSGSGGAGGVEIAARRSSAGQLLSLKTLGSIVNKGANTQNYACIVGHTSGASTEPGVGASWTTYWIALPAGDDDLGASAWVTSTLYAGQATRFEIDAVGVLELVGGPTVRTGFSTPEGAVTAAVGSLFLRVDGGASTTLYVKTSGSGNTGWTAK
jgi:hypothetical protein